MVTTYLYDTWGNHLHTTGSLSATVGRYNPLRYRGYVYDRETGLYYLQSRYYNPETGRFINGDGFTTTGQGVIGNNMFAYCENNPVVRIDVSGCFWDTVFDVITLVASVVDVCTNPDDTMAWVGLAADVVDLIPFVTGVGEVTRAVNTANKVADIVDTTHDISKTVNRVEDIVDTSADSIRYTDKVVKQMSNTKDLNHSFPTVIIHSLM